MEVEAVVTGIQGSDAIVELGRHSGGCGRCHEPGGCGGGGGSLIGQFFGPRKAAFRVPNSIGAQVGERVLLRLGDKELLLTALTVYLLPVVLLVAGAFGGVVMVELPGDFSAFAGGLVGFAGGVLAVIFYQSRVRERGSYLPVLTRRSPCSDPPIL